jgi:hypothetical protein
MYLVPDITVSYTKKQKRKKKVNTDKRTARVVGALFLTAMVTSLAGGIWLDSITSAADYLTTVSANEAQVIIGVLLELINCAAVVGIAAMLFPILKRHNENIARGYFGFRILEAAILSVAVISPLALITLSQEYVAAGAPDASYFQTLGILVMAPRLHLAGLLTATFFSLGAVLLYYSFYQTKLVPRFISIWGVIAVALVLAWNVLEAFGISISFGMIFGLAIILNEVFLGLWLIIKGFDSSAIASESAA